MVHAYSNDKERITLNATRGDSDGCWEWVRATNKGGYGIMAFGGKSELSHRVSYRLFKGKIPDGLCVCHSCDNRKCVNPEHLWLGSLQENIQDRQDKKRQMRGEISPRTTLSNIDAGEIKAHLSSGIVTRKVIAEMYGVSKKVIDDIATGRTWWH